MAQKESGWKNWVIGVLVVIILVLLFWKPAVLMSPEDYPDESVIACVSSNQINDLVLNDLELKINSPNDLINKASLPIITNQDPVTCGLNKRCIEECNKVVPSSSLCLNMCNAMRKGGCPAMSDYCLSLGRKDKIICMGGYLSLCSGQ